MPRLLPRAVPIVRTQIGRLQLLGNSESLSMTIMHEGTRREAVLSRAEVQRLAEAALEWLEATE